MAVVDIWRRWRPLWRLLRVCGLPRALLQAHVEAYGQLAGLELRRDWRLWRRRWLLQVLGLLAALCAAGLSGVALMLWAVVPAEQVHAPWALWAAPLLPAVVALACLWAAQATQGPAPFAGVRRQVRADWALLHGAADGPPSGAHRTP